MRMAVVAGDREGKKVLPPVSNISNKAKQKLKFSNTK
jgi:hypothetical protein